MVHFQEIVADIKKENCVLIIGPDIVDFGEKSFFETMCQELAEDARHQNIIDTAPQYIFANEELLQLLPSAREATLLRMMEGFYQRQTVFDAPLKKISQIPFHLIISLMPDDRLQRIFDAQHLEYKYARYPRELVHAPIDKPTKDKPLLYNLLGDFNSKDAILTFDHLFDFLKGILGKRELPNVILESLNMAGTFIFLGVSFDKWYVQLLLKIITSGKKENYIIIKESKINQGYTFIARRHNLDFLPTEPVQFLDDLYQECGNQEILKTETTKFKARVFISYSSEDSAIVEKIEQRLYDAQIKVVRDEISSHAGQKIEHFIDTIKTVDCVLLVVSENSLQSHWVGKEIVTTLQHKKPLVPCYIDKEFLEENFWKNLTSKIKNKIKEIGKTILASGTNSTTDFQIELNDWKEFNSNIPTIKIEVKRDIVKSLMPEDFEKNMPGIIQTIIKNA